MKKLFMAALCLFFLPIAVLKAEEKPKIVTYQLENGLTVILKEDHNQPKVFGGVIAKAGAKDDPADATGMAHYQEHMLFKGTQTLGTTNWEKEKPHIDRIFELYDQLGLTKNDTVRKDIQKEINNESIEAGKYAILNETSFLINAMGGTGLNAGTGPDQTVFYNQFPPNQMEKWLDLYSERFYNPVFRSFQSELETVYEEKNMYDDQFFTGLFEAFNKRFFKKHPYGQRSIIGTADDLKNPSLSKMYQFFQDWYRPGNMALILVGDFNTNEVKPLIEAKFSKWENGIIPEHKKYIEKEFDGREFFKVRMSPIPIGAIGFRAPATGSDDELAWDMANKVLTNNMQTGLLDQLIINNEMLMTTAFNIPYQDYGETVLIFVPGFFKSLKKAEKKVMEKVALLKSGEFSDDLVSNIKAEMYKTYQLDLESVENQAINFAFAFSIGLDPLSIYEEPAKIKALTKQDIVDIANKYFTDNRLVMHSKMGFPKKDKLQKPDYEPVVSKTNAKSPYRENFEQIESTPYEIKPIDLAQKVQKTEVFPNVLLRCGKNPLNDIAEVNMQFNKGKNHDMMLYYAANAMSNAFPRGMTLQKFKEEMGKTNCSYNFYAGETVTGIKIKGPEDKLSLAYELINTLLEDPVVSKDRISQMHKEELMERKMEKSEPDMIASGLYNYLLFAEKSQYINRLPLKDIKKLKSETLMTIFKDALQYESDIFYVGENSADKVAEELKQNCLFLSNVKEQGKGFDAVPIRNFDKNEVYFINNERSKQSKLFLFINQDKVTLDERPIIEAFNMYFGGGFSGLVLQEIREYRSMAYSAGARFDIPEHKDHDALFYGFVGTQCDKTLDALEIFNGLIRNMPEKPERMDMIKNYLINSAITKQGGFRGIPWKDRYWQHMGYESDPILKKVEAYKKLTFEDIVEFYKKKIKNKEVVIALVGDAEQIEVEKLKKYGDLQIKEWDDVFTK